MELLRELLRDSGRVKISLDIDVTIADIYTPMLNELNKSNAARGSPTSYTPADMTNYNWSTVNSSWPEMRPFYNKVWMDEGRDIKLLINPDSLHALAATHEVTFVTTRDDESTLPGTKIWLARHGIDDIKLLPLLNKENRADMDYRLYIDDNPSLVESITNRDGKVMFLVSSPPSSHIEADGIKVIRVESASAAISTIMRETRRMAKIHS